VLHRPRAGNRPQVGRHRLVAGVLAVAAVLGAITIQPSAGAQDGTDAEQGPASLATPVLSARRAPWMLQGAVADPALAEAVEGTIDRNPQTWCALIEERGRPVLTVNPDLAVAPASVQKLLTGAAFLEAFGPDHTLRTVLAAAAPPVDGVVEGDLYLVGGGDPLFTTSGYQQSFDDPEQPSVDPSVLVDALAQAGVARIRGGVVGDDSRYDAQRWVPTWPSRYKSDPSIGPISALAVNDGFTGYADTPDRLNPLRRAGDPPVLAAQTLITLLEDRGITVDGGPSAGVAPAGATEVAVVSSRPMRDLVGEMVLASDNNTAEMLLKELGLARKGAGTTDAGLAAVTEVLAAAGVPVEGLALRDGSGLDPESRLPCRTVMTVLERYGRTSDLTNHLAVAGRTGTLRLRMGSDDTVGRVFAKTGTLNTVNALAGWAETPAGAVLQFVGIGNGVDPRGRSAGDAFARALMTYPEGPVIDALVPRPVRPPGSGPPDTTTPG
jgi:D-alanyl-D-alanine carboxypeptidase/D-alanyl-D-alanine-endopeptidase (penicillin-binding protein 4)